MGYVFDSLSADVVAVPAMGQRLRFARGAAARPHRWPRRRVAAGVSEGALHLALLVGVATVLAPFAWALATAVKAGPRPWSALIRATQIAPLVRYLVNSLLVSGLTAVGQVITAALAAFVFARLHFRGRDTLFLIFLGTLIIPDHVTMLPTFMLLRRLHWLDSYAALVVPALAQPFAVFLLRQYFVTFSTELEDAARLDGSSRLGLLWHVFLPLSKPALATVGLFSFLWSWNSFLWPLIVLQTPGRYTLPVGLSLLRSEIGTDWPVVLAATLLAALPVVVLFLLAHRWLWRDIALVHYEG
jgi:multiple sugar transport system permease protein